MPQSVFPCTPAAFSVFMRHHDEGCLLSRSTPDAEIVWLEDRRRIEVGAWQRMINVLPGSMSTAIS